MKPSLIILSLGLFLNAVIYGQVSSDRETPSKVLMTCNQLQQEDILQIKLVQKEARASIVLTLKDGEIELATTLPENIESFSFVLPNWKGESRMLRREMDSWVIVGCGGSVCVSTRIQCTY